MKIILDTNIFLGACIGQGSANKLVMRCLQGDFVPLMGAALLAEYEDILGREHLFGNARLSQAEREELLDIFLDHCQWTRIYYAWRPNLRDEGDNHLVELAVAGNARYLVTYNLRDFKNMELKFPEIRICSPEQFFEEVKV
ncbi:putative toxin-antitoxin system toxin component, PIN family [Candidatus Thiothrix anitrata]|uniref:Toxin-antitoxin system toxin component, PIN family n=1 Tax=Candidatus Thiothrix anitrata TaxID=2823902 RepID=A0ABX7X7D5_9GAMM|nr:putative toxin-antitoxin system toxin component, PIN family [Candidatus Thiothrix anitrata]QTR51482.1 putative toxin-antitoxin system toxin component, PIN family [Candidatus Thiothrix anitrata]